MIRCLSGECLFASAHAKRTTGCDSTDVLRSIPPLQPRWRPIQQIQRDDPRPLFLCGRQPFDERHQRVHALGMKGRAAVDGAKDCS